MTVMNPAYDIAKLLDTEAFGVIGSVNPADWALNIDKEPDPPDNTITIYNTPSKEPDPQWRLNYPEVQVRVRGRDRRGAHDKARTIMNRLHGCTAFTGNSGASYRGIWSRGEPTFLMNDSNNRAIFYVNLRMAVEPTDADNRRAL
jgi:hypothetical protein